MYDLIYYEERGNNGKRLDLSSIYELLVHIAISSISTDTKDETICSVHLHKRPTWCTYFKTIR